MTVSETKPNPILTIRGLKTHFPIRRGVFSRVKDHVKAVDGVDLDVRRGKTLGLVGESGSGKTTVGRTLLRLIPATAGEVQFDGLDVLNLPRRDLRNLRSRMQIIFQDPYASLNPRMTVGTIVGEPLAIHTSMTRRQRRSEVGTLLERVGLSGDYIRRYPHEFSGGQRQRIGIARALAARPDFIVCDEPVSALDVSIQAQILNLLNDLQDELGLSYLFIAHNLAVIEHIADDIAVMYLGRIVERAPREAIKGSDGGVGAWVHPYSQALISAVPQMKPGRRRDRIRLSGETPSPTDSGPGCPFHPRCPLTRTAAAESPASQCATIISQGQPVNIVARCVTETPQLQPLPGAADHLHACLLRQT